MGIALWIVSGLLALVYLGSGGAKIALRRLPGPEGGATVSPGLAVTIGVLEVLGAIALVVPWLTGAAAVLTPLAALCLVVLQALAIGFHLRHRERVTLPANVVLLLLALFVAIGRFAGVR